MGRSAQCLGMPGAVLNCPQVGSEARSLTGRQSAHKSNSSYQPPLSPPVNDCGDAHHKRGFVKVQSAYKWQYVLKKGNLCV